MIKNGSLGNYAVIYINNKQKIYKFNLIMSQTILDEMYMFS